MTHPIAAWRVTYTPGDWLVLSGPTMLVVMRPAPVSHLVNRLWDDVLAARSVEALLGLLSEYGLDAMPDFAAFFWDASGLQGMARGGVTIVDTETGEAAVTGAGVVTWREEPLGATRNLRVDMQPEDQDEHLQLPLVVGAVLASTIRLSTGEAAQVCFPGNEARGILPRVAVLESHPEAMDNEVEEGPRPGLLATGALQLTDADLDALPMYVPPAPPPAASDGPAAPGHDGGGTTLSPGPGVAHTPPVVDPPEEQQVLAVTCPRGHGNPPGSQTCRLCSAPVELASPRLIKQPVLASVHNSQGGFADLRVAVLVGRSPDARRAPRGAHLMRVSSPSSDISRSHLLITPRDWSVIVTDLDSTNGTTVNPVGEQPFILAGGDSVEAELGTILDLGDGVSVRLDAPRG